MNVNYRKTLLVGGTAAAILGIGGTALATTGSDAAPSSASSASSSAHAKHHKGGVLQRLEHGTFVTKTKKGTVTHTIYRGTVSAVSSSSLTVKAADGSSKAFAITKDTKFRERAKGHKPVASSLSKIAKGDRVAASGTGTSTVTAKNVVELPAKK